MRHLKENPTFLISKDVQKFFSKINFHMYFNAYIISHNYISIKGLWKSQSSRLISPRSKSIWFKNH